ncbi:PspC domain-containing protein [Gordonia phosphorivorans]|uniref:PspC domain-containing protein n=1 Tax=Gordonia phosphorivorans TaxID=1056982 RepID=A0ABV6HA82_9ACTN
MDATTLSDLWATRPVRRRQGHKVAGVCSGFGARYNVDPTLVRVALVVATIFGGAGILLYVIACFVLPADRTPRAESPADQHHGHFRWGSLIPLVILAVVLSAIFGGDNWSGSGILSTGLLLFGWWLLYQRTPTPPPGTSATTPPEPAPIPEPVEGASLPFPGPVPTSTGPTSPIAEQVPVPEPVEGSSTTTTTVPEAPPTPPAWDPLGAAPFAWDLPAPPPAPPAPKPDVPRSPVTPITLGLALLVVAGGTAAHTAGMDWFTVSRIASLALLVIGGGLLISALQRRPEGASSSGLVSLGALTAAVVIVSALVDASGWNPPKGGIGERNWPVTEQSQLRDHYELTVGSTVLDLRQLPALDADRSISLEQGIGEIVVWLPDDVRVRPECSVTVGDFACPTGVVGGKDDGPILTINAHVGIGNVEMKR